VCVGVGLAYWGAGCVKSGSIIDNWDGREYTGLMKSRLAVETNRLIRRSLHLWLYPARPSLGRSRGFGSRLGLLG
jgi:hypothetical protein